MKTALGSGLMGAIGVTIVNQVAKRYLPEAPRLDILGLRLASLAFQKAGVRPPRGLPIRLLALAGDLLGNSLFFALVGLGKPRTALVRGGALGLAMGVGAVTLPEPLGAGRSPTSRNKRTAAQTIVWYTFGGVIAAITYMLSHRTRR